MCTTCGCSTGEVRIEGELHSPVVDTSHSHSHSHEADQGGPYSLVHTHTHHDATSAAHYHHHDEHAPHHAYVHLKHNHTLNYGAGPARAHAPGLTQQQMVRIEKDILGKNDAYAAQNRRHFEERGIFALNLVSSPGSGKTTLLVRTIEALKDSVKVSVIEGDQQTDFDAERIRATGAQALQVNTGKGCHLDANMVGHAVEHLQPEENSLLMIENVGNLVCPAAFDLGEAHKVVILSVTEGEDKPLKYPDMFAAARVMLLNKCDLLPHVSFDVDRAVEYARRVNPGLHVIRTSAVSGEGFEEWLTWIEEGLAAQRHIRQSTVARLEVRIAELEAQLAARNVNA